MCIVPELEELWVVSRFKIINKFKLDGAPVKKVSLPFPCAAIIPTQNKIFWFIREEPIQKEDTLKDTLWLSPISKSIHKLYLPKWGKKNGCSHLIIYIRQMLTTFDSPDNTDTIYRYDTSEKEILPYYSLDFHGEFLTRDKYPKEDAGMAEIIDKKNTSITVIAFIRFGLSFFQVMGKRDDFCAIRCKDNILFSFDRLLTISDPNM